jgi:hypothetical protein
MADYHWPVSLLMASKVIDNQFNIGIVRAEKAGAVLADAIINRVQGERGVSLVGYGLGARVIYNCLMILSEKRIFGSVENVALMGAPCPSDLRVWAAMKSVVSGRLVNVWSKNDALLAFMYRGGTWQYGLSALQKIDGIQAVENLDVSDLVYDHVEYEHLTGVILEKIGWDDLVRAEVIKGQEAMQTKTSIATQNESAQIQNSKPLTSPAPTSLGGKTGQAPANSGLAEVDINKPQSSHVGVAEVRPAGKRSRKRGNGGRKQAA